MFSICIEYIDHISVLTYTSHTMRHCMPFFRRLFFYFFFFPIHLAHQIDHRLTFHLMHIMLIAYRFVSVCVCVCVCMFVLTMTRLGYVYAAQNWLCAWMEEKNRLYPKLYDTIHDMSVVRCRFIDNIDVLWRHFIKTHSEADKTQQQQKWEEEEEEEERVCVCACLRENITSRILWMLLLLLLIWLSFIDFFFHVHFPLSSIRAC